MRDKPQLRYYVEGYCPLTGESMHVVCGSREQADELFEMVSEGTLSLGKRLLRRRGA